MSSLDIPFCLPDISFWDFSTLRASGCERQLGSSVSCRQADLVGLVRRLVVLLLAVLLGSILLVILGVGSLLFVFLVILLLVLLTVFRVVRLFGLGILVLVLVTSGFIIMLFSMAIAVIIVGLDVTRVLGDYDIEADNRGCRGACCPRVCC